MSKVKPPPPPIEYRRDTTVAQYVCIGIGLGVVLIIACAASFSIVTHFHEYLHTKP